jgi:hypothetical protein
MATGVLGGNPTITKRSFTWTTNLTNFSVYTCPANTICYLTVDGASSSGSLLIATHVTAYGIGFSGSYVTYRESFSGSTFGNLSNSAISAPNYSINPSSGFLRYRLENSLLNTNLYGQVIMFPNEFFYISTANVAGGRTYELNYTTLEIQSGS